MKIKIIYLKNGEQVIDIKYDYYTAMVVFNKLKNMDKKVKYIIINEEEIKKFKEKDKRK